VVVGVKLISPDMPGVYSLAAQDYHADPVAGGSLSSTGARKLLPPNVPAKYKYERDNPPEPTHTFDMGHAAHQVALGVGPELVRLKHDSMRTDAAKAEAREARDRGAIPLKPQDHDVVYAMAEVLRGHKVARYLFNAGTGVPEQTLVWRDPETGVACRAMLDWLPEFHTSRRLIIPDYKTANACDTDSFERAMGKYGYHQQAQWYRDGVIRCGLAKSERDVAFVFVVQEKTPPYLVNVVEPDVEAFRLAKIQNDKARRIFKYCNENDHWYGYEEISLAALPRWRETQIENEAGRGDYDPPSTPTLKEVSAA
jgi:hypothetical protein